MSTSEPVKSGTDTPISDELLALAESVGFEFGPAGCADDRLTDFLNGRAFFTDTRGDTVFLIHRRDDGWLVVTRCWRKGAENFEFAARDLDTLQRYFLQGFGSGFRTKHRMPPLQVPAIVDRSDIQPVTFADTECGALMDATGKTVAVCTSGMTSHGVGAARLAGLSGYLGYALGDLIASFRNPDGAPLFPLWQPPSGTSLLKPRPDQSEPGATSLAPGIDGSIELIDWARTAEYDFAPAAPTSDDKWKSFISDRAYFSSRGGEFINFITLEDGWLMVTSSERMGREQFEFATKSVQALERYFVGYFGRVVRESLGRRRWLPELHIPHSADDVRPGYRVQDVEFLDQIRPALIDHDGNVVAVGSIFDLAALSVSLDSSVLDLQTSFQDREGHPLFTAPPPERPLAARGPDIDDLVDLVRTDVNVNDGDEAWTGYLQFFYVGEGYTSSAGFRYSAAASLLPFAVPRGMSEPAERHLRDSLMRIRDAGDPELRWNAAVIVFHRRSASGDVYFMYGDDAERWNLTPQNADQVAAEGRKLLGRRQR